MPNRRKGMDHDLYPWSNLFERTPLAWPEGKQVLTWIVIDLEWFPITPNDKPFRAPGHMQTAYPDYRHYTSRDYGNRVGIYRLLDALEKAGAKASIAMNSAIADRYPALVRDIVAAGHEIIAHATDMNATIATGVPEGGGARDDCRQPRRHRAGDGHAAHGVALHRPLAIVQHPGAAGGGGRRLYAATG